MPEKIPKENTEGKFETIEPKLVRQIETLNLDPRQKGDIILVSMGLKPSAWIGFDAKIWHEGKIPRIFKTEEDIENLYAVIRESKLSFKILPRKIRTERQSIQKKEINVYHDNVEILIGLNDETLENLSRALESKNHELIGRTLGIPETAIEAFIGKRQKLNLRTIPQKELTSESFLFSPTPTLSKDNWQNEIQEGKRRAEALKTISPAVYENIAQNTLKDYEQQGLLSDKVRRK